MLVMPIIRDFDMFYVNRNRILCWYERCYSYALCYSKL